MRPEIIGHKKMHVEHQTDPFILLVHDVVQAVGAIDIFTNVDIKQGQ